MTFELFFFVLTAAVVVVTAAILFVSLSTGKPTEEQDALGRGEFSSVLENLASQDRAELAQGQPLQLLARATAARHRLEFEASEGDLLALLEREEHGEARLELGLIKSYQGHHDPARREFSAASRLRSDLRESIQLHMAYNEHLAGDRRRAASLFDEIEAPLENKLRMDLGSGEPLFVEWFLHAGALWRAKGESSKAEWALEQAKKTAPDSLLPTHLERNPPA